MSQLTDALDDVAAHDGVRHVLLLGDDGLLIQHRSSGGGENLELDAVAAMIPGLASAAAKVGDMSERGGLRSCVVQLEGGVAVVSALSDGLFLGVLLDAGVGFAGLLRALAARRTTFAALV